MCTCLVGDGVVFLDVEDDSEVEGIPNALDDGSSFTDAPCFDDGSVLIEADLVGWCDEDDLYQKSFVSRDMRTLSSSTRWRFCSCAAFG